MTTKNIKFTSSELSLIFLALQRLGQESSKPAGMQIEINNLLVKMESSK